MERDVVHKSDSQRFEMVVEDRVSALLYDVNGSVLTITSTFVHPEDRGASIAARLTEAALAFAAEQGLKVHPACSYADRYLQRSATWSHLRS